MSLSRRNFLLGSLGGAGALLIGCGSSLPPYQPPVRRVPVPLIGDEVRLAVFGDWGVGDTSQLGVAQGMDRAAAALGGLHGGLLLGDNFYPRGVSSEDDPRWRE